MPPAFKPRRAHKKTRTGCRTCRQRKVKCDENKPVCSNCVRRGLESECEYDFGPANNDNNNNNSLLPSLNSPTTIASTSPRIDYASPASSSRSRAKTCHTCTQCWSNCSSPMLRSSRASSCSRATPPQSEFKDVPHYFSSETVYNRDLEAHAPTLTPHSESAPVQTFSSSSQTSHLPIGPSVPNSAHLSSLQLLHHFITCTAPGLDFGDPELKELWQNHFCSLALSPDSPFLLHAILALSALHLSSQEKMELDQRRRWFITASTHHDATLGLYRTAVAEYVEKAYRGEERPIQMLDTIIATGSMLSIWGFAIRAVRIPRNICLVTSESDHLQNFEEAGFLTWVPLTRGTGPIVKLFRERWEYDLASSALGVIARWWDISADSHPYQQQLDMLDDILKEPPSPEGYMWLPNDILESTIDIIKDCYFKFFAMVNSMSAAASFAARAPDEFVAGLGIQIGHVPSETWRGDPRALVLMSHHVVLFQVMENILRGREKKSGADSGCNYWWCNGVARLDIESMAEFLSVVDRAETTSSSYRSGQGLPYIGRCVTDTMVDDDDREMSAAGINAEKSRAGDLEAPGTMGRWSRWMKWPLEMIHEEKDGTSSAASTASASPSQSAPDTTGASHGSVTP